MPVLPRSASQPSFPSDPNIADLLGKPIHNNRYNMEIEAVEMFLCCVDGQKETLLQIKNGTNYACTGLNNSDQIGRSEVNRMMAILAGAKPPTDTYLPSPLITIDNVLKYYDPDSLF